MSASDWNPYIPYTRQDAEEFFASCPHARVSRVRLEQDREAVYTADVFFYDPASNRRFVVQFLGLVNEGDQLRVHAPEPFDRLGHAFDQKVVDAISELLGEYQRNPSLAQQPIVSADFQQSQDSSAYAGENRVAPGIAWNELYIHSAKRYLFAAERVKGMRVLDLGCGIGYGAKFLARTAEKVVAVDADSHPLAYGNETYPDSKIERIHCADSRLPFEDASFDAVVSMEVVEHIPVDQMESWFAEIGRVLKPGGLLLISTPNKVVYINYPDPHHVALMTIDEYRALLQSRFDQVGLYGQVRSKNLPKTWQEFEIAPTAGEGDEIFVAECSGYSVARPIALPSPTVWGSKGLSVIVHTLNEEANIADCLKSVEGFADEAIVMDMESDDRTREIAASMGARVLSHPRILNFDAARNESAQHASNDWILYLDADERMTPKMAQRIRAYIDSAADDVTGVRLPYRNHFLGQWIQHSGQWWPGYKAPMLLRKGTFEWRPRAHEGVEARGQVDALPADDPEAAIVHFTVPSLDRYFEKMNRYSSSEAEKLDLADARLDWREMARAFYEHFSFYYDETNGKLDGARGFLLSLAGGLSRLAACMKLAELRLSQGWKGDELVPPSAEEFLRVAFERPAPAWLPKLASRLGGNDFFIQSISDPAQRADFESTAHLLDAGTDGLYAFGWRSERFKPKMRALFVPHANALNMMGGGETQMFATLRALREHGCLADVSIALKLPVEEYDLVHLFSTFHPEKLELLQNLNKPVALSTIFWNYTELARADAAKRQIFALDDPDQLGNALTAWLDGQFDAQLSPIEEPRQIRDFQRAVVESASVLLPNAETEAEQLRGALGSINKPYQVVPNAVDLQWLQNADPKAFTDRFGVTNFVLCAARIEPNKNQSMLIWALRDTDIPLVISGKESDPDYAQLCKKWAGDKVHFVGELAPDMLASAYAAAKVHALPSWSETPGLVNLEAASFGTPVVVGNRGAEEEYLGELAYVCDPQDPSSIRTAIEQALAEAPDDPRREARKRLIRDRYSWDKTAQATMDAYSAILSVKLTWFAAPDWKSPESWQSVVLSYLTANERPAALQLLSFDPDADIQTLGAWFAEQGIDAEDCPDIELVGGLPQAGVERAILCGGPLDEVIQEQYGAKAA